MKTEEIICLAIYLSMPLIAWLVYKYILLVPHRLIAFQNWVKRHEKFVNITLLLIFIGSIILFWRQQSK